MRGRCLIVLLVVLSMVVPLFSTLAVPAIVVKEGPGPMVDKPTGNGPYTVGWTNDGIQTSTKAYSVNVRIYYPAASGSADATPDTTGAPYPTIVWLPGFGGSEVHYGSMLTVISSWGFVVMAVAVNWNDWPDSANVSDMEDYLDWLENENVTGASKLFGMVDKEAFGLSGHSSGGGLTVVDSAYVDRIKAAQPLAAAIGGSAIDSLAAFYDKPILFQVGADDSTYIEGSRRGYEKFDPPCSRVEILGAGHQGPYLTHLLAAFYLYYLDEQADYHTYIYGDGAVGDHLNGTYDLWFKLSDTYFFPPEISANVTKTVVDMDEEVTFTGNISGYYPSSHPTSSFVWDLDNDGFSEFSDPTQMELTYRYEAPGRTEAVFKYVAGRLNVVLDPPIEVNVKNVAPTAVAGIDLTVDEDEVVELNGSASYDSPSDNDSLEFLWEFGDGEQVDYSDDPVATHSYGKKGTYTARLKVRDQWGLEVSDSFVVKVLNVVPSVEAMSTVTANEDQEVQLTGNVTDTVSDRPGLKFKWEFGDGEGTNWLAVPTATHVYSEAGLYIATLVVEDDDGETAQGTVKVDISNPWPTGGISSPPNETEVDEDIELEFIGWADDTVSDIALLEFKWDFGDGNSTGWTIGPSTTYAYTKGGTYVATFSVRDDDGALFERKVTVTINNVAPTARIVSPTGSLTIAEDDKVVFEGDGQDTLTDQEGLTYAWVIDGDEVPGTKVERAFTTAGVRTVVFRVTDPDGESGEAEVEIAVNNALPTVTASVDRSSVVEGDTVEFKAVGKDTASDQDGLSYMWDLGDGTTSANKSVTHAYTKAGEYSVVVTVTDDEGGKGTDTLKLNVKAEAQPPKPPKPDDDGDGLGSMMLFGGIGAIVLIVVILLVVLMVSRNRAKGLALDEEPDFGPDDFNPRSDMDLDTTQVPGEEEMPPPGPPVTEEEAPVHGPGPDTGTDEGALPGPVPGSDAGEEEGSGQEEPVAEGPKAEEGGEEGPVDEKQEEPRMEERAKGDKKLDDLLSSIKGLNDK